MKKKLPNPGFEFAFSLGIIISLLLPAVLVVQHPHKHHQVTIPNHDTTMHSKILKMCI